MRQDDSNATFNMKCPSCGLDAAFPHGSIDLVDAFPCPECQTMVCLRPTRRARLATALGGASLYGSIVAVVAMVATADGAVLWMVAPVLIIGALLNLIFSLAGSRCELRVAKADTTG